jgi:hypothetical protein
VNGKKTLGNEENKTKNNMKEKRIQHARACRRRKKFHNKHFGISLSVNEGGAERTWCYHEEYKSQQRSCSVEQVNGGGVSD